jgi:hypothetical protein
MTLRPFTPIDTIGKLMAWSAESTVYAYGHCLDCRRSGNIDLAALAEKVGPDWVFINRRWREVRPMRQPECRDKDRGQMNRMATDDGDDLPPEQEVIELILSHGEDSALEIALDELSKAQAAGDDAKAEHWQKVAHLIKQEMGPAGTA